MITKKNKEKKYTYKLLHEKITVEFEQFQTLPPNNKFQNEI